MAKRILTLCLALVIGIAFAMPAVAAVQSIKVGGDITIRGIYRDNLDFNKIAGEPNNFDSWVMSTTRIWVAPQLTDNISAVVRLLNERDWTTETASSTNIDLDIAYIKLQDLFVPGFTATLGRQEILMGKGFVVGNVNGVTGDPLANLLACDLTSRKSFDAWRLDYEIGTAPLVFTFFDAKISETAPGNNADKDLWGLNVGYTMDNLRAAGYVLLLDQQTDEFNNLITFGARVDHDPFPGLNYNLEAAIQTGKYEGNKVPRGEMEGWAGNADVSYTFQSPMQAKIGAAWYYASGDSDTVNKQGNYVPLYPDNLSDRIGRITYVYSINGGLLDWTGSNLSVPKIYGSFKPSEKNTLALAWFPLTTLPEDTLGESEVMNELNFAYTYQYTEDVSLGVAVNYGIAAGKYIKALVGPDNFDDSALEVIGSVAVKF